MATLQIVLVATFVIAASLTALTLSAIVLTSEFKSRGQ